ncbi:hypothetical protein PWT90_06253 [Aphanocladium album]|nr:hypothetical protein PWT90_06253 [Aphanocladium album]
MTDTTVHGVDFHAITNAPDHEPFTLVPVIRDILRTRYCPSGTIFLVEGVDIIPVSKTGRWQAIRLVLGDGEFCIQALLSSDCHRFVETGEISTGFYIKLERFDLECETVDPEDSALRYRPNQKMAYLALHDLATIGWNDSYRAMAQRHRAEFTDIDHTKSLVDDKGNGKMIQDSSQLPVAVSEREVEKDLMIVKSEPASSGYGDELDTDDAFEDMEKIVFPNAKKSSTPKPAQSSRTQGPVALPRDWTDRQTPLKLTTLHAIPSLPYAQNWTCNVLAVVASLSPVEASYLPPYKQRTARLADPSTAKQVHLTVFLEPESFNPAIGSAVLLTGVKNHRFDGGSLKKYASDSKNGQEWWFEDPTDLVFMELSQGLDIWERQQAIDGFLSSLSSWDLLYLRRRMHAHESRIRLASLEDLPAEIVIYIAQFLELEDLLTCANVSRSWRETWTFGAVTAYLCCRYFPGLTEKYGLLHSEGQDLFSEYSRRYIGKYLRPRPNAYLSSRWFVGNNEPPSSGAAEDMREDAFQRSECLDFGLDSFQMCYSEGLLAWQPDDSYVVLNDLKTLSRSRCSFGASLVSGHKLDLQAVTRNLVVFSSIDLNAGSQICRELNGEAFYWSWGGPTMDLQATASELTAPPRGCVSCLQRVPGAVFHPNEDGIFFLSWVYKPATLDSRIHVIVVVKYQQGKPVQRYETTVANPARCLDSSKPYSDGILRFSLRCQKMNNHGLFMLGVVHTCLHYHGNKSTLAVSQWKLVCFNVLTESFIHRTYDKCLTSPKFHRPTWDWAEWRNIQAWDDYLVVLWQPRPHVIHEPCTFTELLLATDNIACISSSQNVFGDIMRPNRLEPALTIDAFHQRRSAVANHVFMDDDFIVYASPDSILVSTFKGGKDVTIPPPVNGSPMTALASLAAPRQAEPPVPLQTWDCEVYTTLEAQWLET